MVLYQMHHHNEELNMKHEKFGDIRSRGVIVWRPLRHCMAPPASFHGAFDGGRTARSGAASAAVMRGCAGRTGDICGVPQDVGILPNAMSGYHTMTPRRY